MSKGTSVLICCLHSPTILLFSYFFSTFLKRVMARERLNQGHPNFCKHPVRLTDLYRGLKTTVLIQPFLYPAQKESSLSSHSRIPTACWTHSHIQGVIVVLRCWEQWLPTLLLSLVSSNSFEGKRVPLRATVSLGSGPDDEELEESDRALSCSSRDKTIPSPCSSEESRVWAVRGQEKEGNQCLCWLVCISVCDNAKPSESCQSMWVCVYLLKEWEVTAALSEAQQQRQDVDGARRLLGLLGTRHSRVSLGHTKLLGHWGGKTNRVSAHTNLFQQYWLQTRFHLKGTESL